ncbi:MAG TPA: SprT family zinc-dependent metalloprotease [Polyangia bacterium]
MNAFTSAGESSAVQFGRTLLAYQIKRSQRRATVSIAVVPNEGLVVTAPAKATTARLDDLVRRKGAWIARRLKHQDELPPALPEREFVSGETFKYLGRQYRLRVKAGAPGGQVHLHGPYLNLILDKALSASLRAPGARQALVEWYRAKARQYLPRRAAQWSTRLALPEPRIVVAEPPKRWGSTSKNGTVRINWRVLQCPVSLVDYVVAHELVHLIHEDHSRAFWATLGAIMPDYEDRKKRLRAMGPRLVW